MYFAAPLLVLAYGVARLVDGLDGDHGPGLAWTIGHLLFLVALVLFGLVALDARRRVANGWGQVAAAATVIGLLAMARTIVIDLIVGLRASDHAQMSELYARYSSAIDTAVDPLAPLFPVGLFVLLVLLAVARRAPWWSPVVAALAFASIVATLDTLPIAGALLLIALAPARPRRRSHAELGAR